MDTTTKVGKTVLMYKSQNDGDGRQQLPDYKEGTSAS